MNRIKLGLVSAGFLGCMPLMPGTFGTVAGLVLAWSLAGAQHFVFWVLGLAGALYLVGYSLADWAERHAGRKDPSFFVLDEVVGYLIAVAWAGPGLLYGGPSYLTLVLAFLAFRFFDVLKPSFVRRMELLPGGHGIMADDVAAGILAFLVVAALRLTVGEPGLWTHGPVAAPAAGPAFGG